MKDCSVTQVSAELSDKSHVCVCFVFYIFGFGFTIQSFFPLYVYLFCPLSVIFTVR